MEYQQNYCNSTNIFARQNSRRPVITQIQYYYRRMCCNLFVVVLAFSGLISSQVAQAVVLPKNIVSKIHYWTIDDSSTPQIVTHQLNEEWDFNNNPAPFVTNHDFRNNSSLVGTSYADAQGQWGVSSHARFTNAGVYSLLLYSAFFTKENNQDVVTTKISNTSLSLRDFGSQSIGDMNATFRFRARLYNGIFNILDVPVYGGVEKLDKHVSIWGRADKGFQLSGDYDFFTGVFAEEFDAYGTQVLGASYDLDAVSFKMDLDEINVGEDFTVVWIASTDAIAQGGETFADAQFWDPIGGIPGPFFSVGPGTSSPVPEPAVLWLFGSGLLGLVGMSSRKRKLNQDKLA